MLRKIKNKSELPAKQDFAALDEAVSELSKRTTELLGSADATKKAKPVLPKKHAKVIHTGKSFDIIHNPKQPTKLKATLKTRTSKEAAVPEISLTPPPKVVANAKKTSISDNTLKEAAIINPHKEGSLQSVVEPPASAPLGDAAEAIKASKSPEETPKEEDSPVVAEVDRPVKDTARSSLSFTEEDETPKSKEVVPASPDAEVELDDTSASDPEVAEKQPAQPVKEDTKKTEEPKAKAAAKSDDKPAAEPTSYSGELYSNNLVKDVKPKGYQSKDDESKPVVFDTDEYHPELHDWSQLGKRHHTAPLLLLLLVSGLAMVIYVFVLKQKLPF